VRHQWTNELTNRGLCPTILGEERPYQLLNTAFQREVGASFQLTYDPQDLSTVLATSLDGLRRYLVPEVAPIPMALMDHTPETRAQLAATEAFKKELSQGAIDRILNDRIQLEHLADQLLLDASLVRRSKATSSAEDVTRRTPEQDAVEKNYLMTGGSHKAAQRQVKVKVLNRTEAEIAQRATDQL
jgi:ribosomal protein L20A (L18A)